MARAWNAHEDAIVRDLWGVDSPRALAVRLGRSRESIRRRADALGLPAYRDTAKTIGAIARETGYHRTRILGAARRLGLKITHGPGGWSRVRADQEERILHYLATLPDGKRLFTRQPGVWRGRRPGRCRRCRRTAQPHHAHGYCKSCYHTLRRRPAGIRAFLQWVNNGRRPRVEAAE